MFKKTQAAITFSRISAIIRYREYPGRDKSISPPGTRVKPGALETEFMDGGADDRDSEDRGPSKSGEEHFPD